MAARTAAKAESSGRTVAQIMSRRQAAQGGNIKEMQEKLQQLQVEISQEQKGARSLMHALGIDPLMDFDITWVMEEYKNMLQQPLPQGWKIVKHLGGAVHYVNLAFSVDTTDHPALKRFRRLVTYLKWAKEVGVPVNDLLVLEMLEPIHDPADVMTMCRRLEINPMDEPHLTWIAKKAVLEGVPDGWQRTVAKDGTVEFHNLTTGTKSKENPIIRIHQQLVRRARLEARPKLSVLSDLYTYAPARFEPGTLDEHGMPRKTKEIPMTGPWMDFVDYYGRHFWYNLVTGTAKDSLDEMRQAACVVTIQRHWRGHHVRSEILRMADAVARLETFWRQKMFARCVIRVREQREEAARYIQRMWRAKKMRREFCEEMVVRIGMLGMRRPMRTVARQRVAGLLQHPVPFTTIRRKVIVIQRAVRVWLAIRHLELPPDVGLISDAVIKARAIVNQLWGGFG